MDRLGFKLILSALNKYANWDRFFLFKFFWGLK